MKKQDDGSIVMTEKEAYLLFKAGEERGWQQAFQPWRNKERCADFNQYMITKGIELTHPEGGIFNAIKNES